MSEIVLKKNIKGYLSLLTDLAKKNTAKGLFDINKESEDTVAELLNVIFNYKLENANKDNPRYPGIDLIDIENKITVQVTSTTTFEKVYSTCRTVIGKKYYNSFNTLMFYYITNKSVDITRIFKGNVEALLGNYIKFDLDKGIFNNESIYKDIEEIGDLEKIVNIERVLSDKLSLPNGGRMDPVRGYIIPKRLNRYAGYSINDLVGRVDKLSQIHALFEERNIVLLTGLGGIGKTTVAKAYLEIYSENYNHLAYVDVSNNIAESILNKLSSADKNFERNSNLNSRENLEVLIENLRTIYNTILVIDNCNDEVELREIKPLLESLNWKIIITSRTKPQTYRSETIDIEHLNPQQAFELFTNFYQPAQESDADIIQGIIERAYYHTKLIILIAKAASYNPLLDLKVLADRVASNAYDDEIIDIDIEFDAEERSVYSFILAIFEPETLNPYLNHYLRFFSVLPSQEIPINHLFELFEKEQNQGYLINTLNKLTTKGWIERYANDYYRIHPLVQLVTQRKLSPTVTECKNLITNLIDLIDESVDLYSLIKYIPYCEGIVGYFKNSPSTNIALLLNKMAPIYVHAAQYKEAIQCCLSALEILNNPDHKNIQVEAQSYGLLMVAYLQIDDHDKAIEAGLKCIKIQEEILPDTHPDLAATYSNISTAFRRLEDPRQALYYVLKGIKILKWHYHNYYTNRTALNLINSYQNLAAIQADFSRFINDELWAIKSLFVLYRSLVLAKRLLPPNNVKFAVLYNDISLSLRDLNCLDKSMQYFEDAIKIHESVYPHNHPALGLNYCNMGKLYKKMNDTDNALLYARKALNIQQQNFDPTHFHVIETLTLIESLQ